MASIMWASVFLVFIVIGASVICFSMMGMPIAAEIKAGLTAMAVLLVVSGAIVPALSSSDTTRTG